MQLITKFTSSKQNDSPIEYRWTEYEDRNRKARLANSDEILENRSSAHAAVVIRELVIQATEMKMPLRIVSGELFPDCYDKLVDQTRDYLESRPDENSVVSPDEANFPSIRLIITNWNDVNAQENKFYKLLQAYTNTSNPKVQIKTTSSNFPHFAVAGEHSYRYEMDHISMAAKLSYNHEKVAKFLVAKFDEEFNSIP